MWFGRKKKFIAYVKQRSVMIGARSSLCKRIDGTYYVIEAVNSSKRKKNYVVSAFMSKAED